MSANRVLIIYYSYSGQTRKILQSLVSGMEEEGITVCWQQLVTRKKLSFPFNGISETVKMMVVTFLRKHYAIEPPEKIIDEQYDLILLAGPTWSYNPSGPVLQLLAQYGGIFKHQKVLPVISCRGYWRTHYYQLKLLLGFKKAEVLDPVVFLHTGPEPWRTIGVFLKLAGRVPESSRSWISKYYKKFGHTRKQISYARECGRIVGRYVMTNDKDLVNSAVIIGDID